MTTEIPEFHYCASCGFLAEGGPQQLRCRCRKPQPEPLDLEPATPANVARVREAIALGGRIRV